MKFPADHIKIESTREHQQGGQQAGMGCNGCKVTHIPSGNVAICKTGRSQTRNKETALEMIEWSLTNSTRNWT